MAPAPASLCHSLSTNSTPRSSSISEKAYEAGGEDCCATKPLMPGSKDKDGSSWFGWRLAGPGLLACLADTDAGCLMVAAQSGARWGYSLLLMQILLIPILFCAQELTIRLAVHTEMGHAACIKQYFGRGWAWVTSGMLAVECVLAMIQEMSGIAAAMELWDLSRPAGTAVAAFTITAIVVLCKYRQIEVIGITVGLFEMTFVITMFALHPSATDVFTGMFTTHFSHKEYLELYSANIGAVIVPYMIYFQQSAIVARRLRVRDVPEERTHTLVGSVLTQLVMIGTIVTFAVSGRGRDLESIRDMHSSLSSVLGPLLSKVSITLALIGGSLCASFVVALSASWAICDAIGWDEAFSLDRSPSEAPRFYLCFLAVVGIGFVVLQTDVHLVTLNVFIDLVDGLLMPVAIAFLYTMACSDLIPEHARVKGNYKILLGMAFFFCCSFSLTTGVGSLVSSGHPEILRHGFHKGLVEHA